MHRLWLAICLLFSTTVSAEELLLDWIDLIPEKERNQVIAMPMIDHEGEAQQSLVGDVRTELNGSEVKIPGFVIPLEGDDQVVTEFLLVPYFGACIHVPPPPPNQIVYVKFAKGAPLQELWDVVYVTGILKTEHISSELAEVAYILEGNAVLPYDEY
ncbi:hypothetical protein VST7929_00366 [Vibrio stylophorae]|uniref:DUF3299 domain-containing protein n=1 Tax=Vibrio stylophorae TaxID=659351 RepID=A0ABM8ZQQ6_9VIBR|nr:DUF3299 domain-containing protein [Vibrio stylophorae]CAH0532536.1 hypothetical protein VST7929_00366 [Vibrio stylophorae]